MNKYSRYDSIRNYVWWSSQFRYWTDGLISVSLPEYDFLGEEEATKITEWRNWSWHYIQESEQVYYLGDLTFSIYAKEGERNFLKLKSSNLNTYDTESIFNLTLGTVVSGDGNIESTGDGWYRCSVSSTVTNHSPFSIRVMLCDNNMNDDYQGDGVSGLYIRGAQMNPGLGVENYIETQGGPE